MKSRKAVGIKRGQKQGEWKNTVKDKWFESEEMVDTES